MTEVVGGGAFPSSDEPFHLRDVRCGDVNVITGYRRGQESAIGTEVEGAYYYVLVERREEALVERQYYRCFRGRQEALDRFDIEVMKRSRFVTVTVKEDSCDTSLMH